MSKVRDIFVTALTPKFGQREATAMWKHLQPWLLQNADVEISCIIDQCLAHVPVQYITNEAYFYDWSMYVDKNVLIPRPETEELVHWIIEDYRDKSAIEIIDIGAGSGCIINTLGKHLATNQLTAVDISQNALDVTKRNAKSLNLTLNVKCVDILRQGNQITDKYDIVVSNPPYIAHNDEQGQMTQNTLLHEPDIALYGPDDDPLAFYRWIATQGQSLLKSDGRVYVELNSLQANAIKAIFENAGWQIEIRDDMQRQPRMLRAKI